MSSNTSAPDEAALPAVGVRFLLRGERGTVRYVGPVPPAKGVWLGVEWDNAARGKHDGVSADGTRYFDCRQPGAGSFIRPSGPKAKLDLGTSFLKALRSRYALVPTFNEADTQQVAHHSRRNLAEIEIEVPNVDALFKKELVLERLRIVAVGSRAEASSSRVGAEEGEGAHAEQDEEEVARAYDADAGEEKEGDIAKAIPNVKELDMSRSLIPTWDEVGKITRELPRLETLLLHFNRFAPLKVTPPPDSFSRVRQLALDGALITWDEILTLSEAIPLLEQLELRKNKMRSFASSPTSQGAERRARLPNLKSLNLQENYLDNWHDLVTALSVIPQLSHLVLSSNAFSNIPPPQPEDDRRLASLAHIAIDSNPLQSWADVEAMSAWCCPPNPSREITVDAEPLSTSTLSSLAIGGEAPFLEGLDVRDVRAIAIARLPTLKQINGTVIRAAERRDAEIWYLGRVAEERLDEAVRNERHPRFAYLGRQYGFTAEDSAKRARAEEADTLRSRLIELQVYRTQDSPPALPPSSTAVGTIKLLSTAPLRSSMAKIAKACGLRQAREVKEVWAALAPPPDDAGVPAPEPGDGHVEEDESSRILVPLDNPTRELSWYGVQSGDLLFVVEKST